MHAISRKSLRLEALAVRIESGGSGARPFVGFVFALRGGLVGHCGALRWRGDAGVRSGGVRLARFEVRGLCRRGVIDNAMHARDQTPRAARRIGVAPGTDHVGCESTTSRSYARLFVTDLAKVSVFHAKLDVEALFFRHA
jgi:hypothetical protein